MTNYTPTLFKPHDRVDRVELEEALQTMIDSTVAACKDCNIPNNIVEEITDKIMKSFERKYNYTPKVIRFNPVEPDSIKVAQEYQLHILRNRLFGNG